jgi:hypothetical protein
MAYHLQGHFAFLLWMLENRQLDILHCSKTNDGTTVKLSHEWRLNFIGHVKLMGRYIGNKYILVATYYATKWVEARASQSNMVVVTTKFLYECILTKLGCPLSLVFDQGVHFINDTISHLVKKILFWHITFTTYYLQGNGQT